jgi:hypothetical protein
MKGIIRQSVARVAILYLNWRRFSETRVRRATERVACISLFIIIRGYLKDVIKI